MMKEAAQYMATAIDLKIELIVTRGENYNIEKICEISKKSGIYHEKSAKKPEA